MKSYLQSDARQIPTSQYVTKVYSMCVMNVGARIVPNHAATNEFWLKSFNTKLRFIFTSRPVRFYGYCLKYLVIMLVYNFLTVDNSITPKAHFLIIIIIIKRTFCSWNCDLVLFQLWPENIKTQFIHYYHSLKLKEKF